MKSSIIAVQSGEVLNTDRLYRIGLVLIVGLGLAAMFDIDPESLGVSVMPQMMAVGLGVGVTALLLGFQRLCLLSFAVSGVLAYRLMMATVPEVIEEREVLTEGGTFHVEQYSTSNIFLGNPDDLHPLINSNADVLSVQGLTPNWARALGSALTDRFPHQYLFPDIGVHGIGLFARTPLGSIDSAMINGILQVKACVSSSSGEEDLHLMAIQTVPPVSNGAYLNLQSQLEAISNEIRRAQQPVILVGDFNAVPWSPELNRFSYRAGVRDSRRCQLPSYEQGTPGLFEAPVEHIFYNDQLKCVRFETLRTREHYLGNRASFQPASSPMVAL